ncbi:MAG: L-asparaginase / beta-aspartyl-peptidase [Sphingomonadales bacterium]|jgi:beta-aspartyl-peptidase (threonine type)|nr:L-asparaginase / beta-aspartyl-peptidase [Sphingomonadales bacterium]
MFENKQGRWALIVHGGAKPYKPSEDRANREGVRQALEAGRAILAEGGGAVDATEAAVRVLEELPVFNASRGAALNERGEIELSAGMMDGRDLKVGAIGYVSTIRHPVSVAKALLPEKWVLLVGEGALKFAEEKGAEFVPMDSMITQENREELKEARDTVGAVALDMGGNIAVASGTGGLTGAAVGRVSDTAMPGCGYYADNHIGAVAFSGDGETIARLALAARVMASLEDGGSVEHAIAKAVAKLPGTGGAGADGGGIGISKDGQIGWAHNSPMFAVAFVTSEMEEPKIYLKKDEERRG